MTDKNPVFPQPRLSSIWSCLLVLAGFILIGMAIGNTLALALVFAVWSSGSGFALENLPDFLQNPEYTAESWYALITLQSIGHLFTFLIPGLLYWLWMERRKIKDFNFRKKSSYHSLAPVFFLTLTLMPFTSVVTEWNESMLLPKALASLEEWMKESEESTARLTKFLVSFDTPVQLLVAILVIGVIPALGEEVLFRGILQRKLAENWANVHLAIWVSAALFSAIHFQFYGFLPRLLLGAMFGYLYFWTGRLETAVFAHFVNNAVTVLLIWMHRKKMISINIETHDLVPVWAAVLSVAASALLLRHLYRTQFPQAKPGAAPHTPS